MEQAGPGVGSAQAVSPKQRQVVTIISQEDRALRSHSEGRLIGLRTNRWSWWTHWRELADYILPRRYKWLITPNQQQRGSPINQHILDNTGTLSARNLAAGIMTGCTDPTKRWFKLKIRGIDSTSTSPTSLWLSQAEKLLDLIFQESNFYTAIAILYFDLVVFGTATMLIYEDFNNVINCINPCLGEFYLDVNKSYFPDVFYREFTMTVAAVVDEFGLENVSPSIARLWTQGGASLTRELIVAHAIEPNLDGRKFGISDRFKFREVYWEWGGSASPQGGSSFTPGLLRKRGYHESPAIAVRWDVVSNDAYGRGCGMDALPDIKQLQLETKRKAQGIDKMVNPPMVADVQLKNAPASLLPGGITYISGMLNQNKTGFAPVYMVNPQLNDMTKDIERIQKMISETFYNNLFQTMNNLRQGTSSNVTATEIDATRAEAMIMLGPVLDRINFEGLRQIVERVFGVTSRAGILPPPPPEIAGANINIEFVSMLEQAQDAADGAGIERILQLLGNLAGVKPEVMDVVDTDYAIEALSHKLGNDPRLINPEQKIAQIRADRAKQQQQAMAQQHAEAAQKLAQGAQTLSQTDVGGGQNALAAMIGQAGQGGGGGQPGAAA
jgi:hypothetical protein